ncbi:MAG: DUF5666 domain-containing protein [Candidatus Brocadiaceae bacterium]|uniref:DUF5666 domain-containing protein n=1 Tax=Candidatus Wunengus sp. YC61 TaxID=3367698 RepID=UPI0027181C86|nr:DUF5666 domain-containing protein [Candidatus Brocadiaceae bacterium]
MFAQMKKGFVSRFLVIGLLVIGTSIPVFAGTSASIMGAVSSIDGTALTLNILNDFVEVNASNATIRAKGVKNATLSDIAEGDIVWVKGKAHNSGSIEATRIKDPVKLGKEYDGKLTGETENVNTSAKTFKICGQKVDAESISGINMSSKTISFGNLRSGVSVDVYVKAKSSGLAAKSITIRSESCNYCH